MIAAASGTWAAWLVNSQTFALDPARVDVSELVYTTPDVIRDVIDLSPDATPNVFRIDTRRMERALASLPAVATSDVSVSLPDSLRIEVTERTPTFVVATPTTAYVLDVEGFVLDEVSAAQAGSLDLPVVDDRRRQFAPALAMGGRLDAISLAASLRLLALTPSDVGSGEDSLVLSVDDTDGYVLTAEPSGWRAIFGHYTQNLRPTELIDRQVQCLRSRLGMGESVTVVYLAPQGEHCGTYVPGANPVPERSPDLVRSGAPSPRP